MKNNKLLLTVILFIRKCIEFFDKHYNDAYIFILMEYVKGKIPEFTNGDILQKATSNLEILHFKNIVYGDIREKNLL